MVITFQSVAEYGLDETIDLLNRGFSDYIIPLSFPQGTLMLMIRQDSVDIGLSQVVFRDGVPVGAGLISRRGWSSRLSGMALIPEGRGQGVGRALLTHLIKMSTDRGDHTLYLEVIESNTPAVALYKGMGFEAMRRLISLKSSGDFQAGDAALSLEEVDITKAANRINLWGYPDLPWQLSGETLAHAHPPAKAYRSGAAYAVITDPTAERIAIRSLIVDPIKRRQGEGSKLLSGLFKTYPNKTWIVPALYPEEFQPFFEACGFVLEELSQLQMKLHLPPYG